MEAIRSQYALTALRVGYSQGSRTYGGDRQVTFALRGPDVGEETWGVATEGIPLLAATGQTRSDVGVEQGVAECLHHLQASPAIDRLKNEHAALWLAVTSEHPLLPGVAWERGLSEIGLPLLRLPAQLNISPTSSPSRPRVAMCVSMPVAKASFSAEDLVGQALEAVAQSGPDVDVHVFADAELAPGLQDRFGTRAMVHDPRREGPYDVARRSMRPRSDPLGDHPSWLSWIEDRMEGRVDVLHLVGHGYLGTGQGAFAVSEAPDRNHDTATARFVWPQQIAALMTSTGAWGLVATAAPQNYSVPGLRLLTSQVAGLRAAATAFLDVEDPATVEPLASVYRLLLRHPAPPPPPARGLMVIMHPGRFGLDSPGTRTYLPAKTELAGWVDDGVELPAWMVGAQHQVRQWETELSFDSVADQVESTRTALDVAKSRLDEVMRQARQAGAVS